MSVTTPAASEVRPYGRLQAISLLVFFFVSLALLGTSIAFAQTPQKLNPTNRTFELQSPVQLNNQVIGSLAVTIDPQDNITLSAADLLSLFGSRLTDQVVNQLIARQTDDRLSASALRDAGLVVEFDMSRLSLVVRAADSMLTRQLLSLEAKTQARSDIIQPTTFSGFLNLRGLGNYTQSTSENNLIWRVDTDAKIRIVKPVLEIDGGFEETSEGDTQWIRRRTRIFYDLPNLESRFSVGDVFTTGQGFQSSLDVLGVQFGRDFQLVAGRNVRPLGSQQFSIDRPSIVSVVVDGLTVRTLELDAGRYDLQDIPLSVGSNFVTLIVESDIGDVETLDFQALYDNGLLDIGEIDYGLTGGILADSGGSSRSYQTDSPAVSLFARTGLRPWLTAAINAQWTTNDTLLGIEALSASPIGPFRLNIATSVNFRNLSGWAAGIDYRSIQFGVARPIASSFNAIYRSANFSSADGADIVTDELSQDDSRGEYVLSAQSSIQWSNTLSASLGFVLSERNDSDGASSTLFSSLSGRLAFLPRVGWSARLEWIDTPAEDEQLSASIAFVYRPSRIDSLFTAFDSGSADARFGFSRKTDSTHVGGYTAEVELRDSDGSQRATLDAGYTANRFLTSLNLTDTESEDARERSNTTSSALRFETAIAIAGNSFGVGRPISNSFALVEGHKTLAGKEIRISPSGSAYTSKNTWFGAALVPGLGRNATKTIGYSVDDLPLGYDLGSGIFAVKPPEGAGYALTVGSAATVTVVGVLTDAGSGDTLPLITGKVFSVADETLEPQIVFTNRTGKFAISGIAPGLYTLALDGTERTVTIEIPDDGQTLLRLGEVLIK